ncbi:MAG TPA: Ig-like domain-containing protein [Mycobacteriales bacterium]
MPSVAAALLSLAVQRPVTDAGVWLDKPPAPGTVLTAPLTLKGETQAPEGVLSVRLYVVTGTTSTELAAYTPTVPVGTVPFTFTWAPKQPGSYTIRVVSTTLLRGFSAEVRDLRVVAAPAARPVAKPAARAPRVAPARPAVRPAPRRVAARARLDDSGRAFGRSAPTLPYPRAVVRPAAPAPARLAAPAAVPVGDRRGWVSFAGGLLLLLVCSHLHRSLRPQPDAKGT